MFEPPCILVTEGACKWECAHWTAQYLTIVFVHHWPFYSRLRVERLNISWNVKQSVTHV
jgi:hypothetical protein